MKKIFSLDHPALTVFLCTVTPFAFLWSNNWHMHSTKSLATSSAFVFGFGVILFFLSLMLEIFCSYIRPKNKFFFNVLSILLCSLAASILAFLLAVPFGVTGYRSIYFASITTVIISCFVFISAFQKIKFLNVMLIAWFVLATLKAATGVAFSGSESVAEINSEIKFKTTPNVYLIILESYHNFDTLQNVYGIDIANFRTFLKENNFIDYPDVYSPSFGTLPSLGSLFALQPLDPFIQDHADVGRPVRDIIGGSRDNFVARVFKENGYFTGSIYFNPAYYMVQQGPYLDKVDVNLEEFGPHTLMPILEIHIQPDKIYRFIRRSAWMPQLHKNLLSPRDSIRYLLDFKTEKLQPHFITLKIGADHTPPTHHYDQADQWVASGKYQKMFSDDQNRLLPLLQELIQTDPDAVIILLGDHGAGRYRGIFPLKSRVKKQSNSDDILATQAGKKNIADDFFGVLCAIRIPAYGNISYGYALAHQNLFWHIFAALSKDQTLLKNRTTAYSKIKNYLLVKDGQVLEDNSPQ